MIRLIAAGDIRLVDGGPVAPARPADASAIDGHWRQYLAGHPQAFDGAIVAVTGVVGDTIHVGETRFSRWAAERAGVVPAVLRPLAVTGLLSIDAAWLFCKRGGDVFDDAGLWEPAPSGGVTPEARDDAGAWEPLRVLRNEAREELGVGPQLITEPRLIGMVEDEHTRVVDLIYRGELAMSAPAFDAIWRQRLTREYVDYALVRHDDLHVWSRRPYVSALSRFCVEHLCDR